MVSAATSFFAIHGSPIVRAFFIPVCSLILLSPFVGTVLELSGLGTLVYPWIPSSSTFLRLFFVYLVLVVNTRIWRSGSVDVQLRDGSKRVALLPYWFPVVGHFTGILLLGERFFRSLRDNYKSPILALSLGGVKHNVLKSTPLIEAFNAQDYEDATSDPLTEIAVRNAFGIEGLLGPEAFSNAYRSAVKVLSDHFTDEKHLDGFTQTTTSSYRENLPNLVTFTSSIVDQMAWERRSDVAIEDGEDVVEANLLSLIQNFAGSNILPSFIGSSLLESYPEFLTDLWTMHSSFYLLAIGLPRWFPIPGLVPAHIARRRLLLHVGKFNHALDKVIAGEDPGTDYRDLSDVSEAYLALQATIRTFGPSIRNGLSVYAIWVFSNSIILAYWMLYRVLSQANDSNDALDKLRLEINSYASVTQAPPTLGFSEPPRLKYNVDGLVSKCPLLKASYIETVRMDTRPWISKQLMRDIIAPPPIANPKPVDPPSFRLQKDEFVDLSYCLVHSDPSIWADSKAFMPSRHTKTKKNKAVQSEWGHVRPFGCSDAECKVTALAERQCLVLVSGLLALWDFNVDFKGSKTPKKKHGVFVDTPKEDIRVKIKRRTPAATA